ncbi:MAG: transcriptional repressor NrdR [Clostridia bacterium]|nr:transcriptional repressor NrdR [Clostridia bacterium]
MKCPFCGQPDTKVIDTRPHDDGEKIRRRRLCEKCNMRFTTYETVDRATVWVVKKDGSREPFNGEKLLTSMVRACRKQSVSIDRLKKVVSEMETRLFSSSDREISSVEIGEFVLERLRKIDEVACVRFASVYRDFSDIDSFYGEIMKMKNNKD